MGSNGLIMKKISTVGGFVGNQLWKSVLEDPQEFCRLPGTLRCCTAEETLARLKPFMSEFGITRLADVTGLDVLDLPVYQAIRPNSRNISVSQGKGVTPALAQVSAIMEAAETFHAEEISGQVITSAVREIREILGYDPQNLAVIAAVSPLENRLLHYDPFSPPVGNPSWLKDESVVEWVAAIRLSDGKDTWVPKQLCELDFTVRQRWRPPFFRATSNGLASGNTVTEALIHGICECIERDCLVRAGRHRDQVQAIDLDTIGPGTVRDVLDRFLHQNFKIVLFDITGPTGVPCFEAIACDRENRVSRGAGCHSDRSIAITRALCEAAQGRLAKIAGSRDDLYREMYLPISKQRFAALFQTHAAKPVWECSHLKTTTPFLTLKDLACRVERYARASPLAVDLRRHYQIPVVFVVTPGLGFQPPARSGHFFFLPVPMDSSPVQFPHVPVRPEQQRQKTGTGALRVCLFAGPSIGKAEVIAQLQGLNVEVTCRPPVQQGDLLMLLSTPPDIVGLIDGYFMHTPSVAHKEILLLLEKGVKVLGAGSMGALRAAELDVFGMKGVGTVYQWYRNGVIDGDDEVAMSHGDTQEEFQPLTEPLVNIRHCLERAVEERVVEKETAVRLLQTAKILHFSERTWKTILDSASDGICDRAEIDRLRDFQLREHPNLKRDDALLLLRKIAGLTLGREEWPVRITQPTPHTRFLHVLQRDYSGHMIRGHHVAASAALSLYKLFSPIAAGLARRACNQLILSEAANSREDIFPPAQLSMGWRRRKKLLEPRRFAEWLNVRGLGEEEIQIYLAERYLAAAALKAGKTMNPGMRMSQIYRSVIVGVSARAGVDPRMILRRYIAPGYCSDEILLIGIKIRGEYYRMLEKAFCMLNAVFGESRKTFPPHLIWPDNARLERWCAQLWHVPLAEVCREAERRAFMSYPELMQTAALAYLAEKRSVAVQFSGFATIRRQLQYPGACLGTSPEEG